MSDDPTLPSAITTSTITPTNPPPQPKPILARVGDTLAAGAHAAGNFFDRLGEDVAEGAEDIAPLAKEAAALAWKNAAAGLVVLIDRNNAELTQKIEAAIMRYLITLAPGAAPAADVITGVVLNEVVAFLAFVKDKLEAQAATPLAPIGPPLSPTPATEAAS